MGRIADAFTRFESGNVVQRIPAADGAGRVSLEDFAAGETIPPRCHFPPGTDVISETAGRSLATRVNLRNGAHGHLPRNRSGTSKLVGTAEMSGFAEEQYRTLGAALLDAQLQQGIKVVLITSALGGEGKTLTAANLALTLSESYQRQVLLIDTDLRRPTIHELFNISTEQVAAHQLRDEKPWGFLHLSPKLALLAPGEWRGDPMTALASHRMRELISAARAEYDWVVLDTPPATVFPDASVLAPSVDGVVVVVAAGTTPYPQLQRTCDAVGAHRVMGVVLNRMASAPVIDAGYYHGSSVGRG